MVLRRSDNLPDVHLYLDYRAFLRDWFEAKKEGNPKFSHRMFARMAGQKSPSLMHHVMRGERNLTPATAEAFVKAMKLPASQADFFSLLVKLGQASTDEERNEAWERIAATRRFREARRVEGAGVEYLSHWFYPAIRELAHRPDFRADPAWIAGTLRPRISVAKATRALELLFELELLAEHSDGRVRPTDASVVTPHEVVGLAVHNYHHSMIARADEALETIDQEERQFGALTVAISSELLGRLKQEIAAFQERVLHLCDDDPEPDRVVQLNIQLFPLSDPREP